MENPSYRAKPLLSVVPKRPLFRTDELKISASVMETISPHEVAKAVARHACGDWGNISAEECRTNERALVFGYALVSIYRTRDESREFFILTYEGRKTTFVFLPEEV